MKIHPAEGELLSCSLWTDRQTWWSCHFLQFCKRT